MKIYITLKLSLLAQSFFVLGLRLDVLFFLWCVPVAIVALKNFRHVCGLHKPIKISCPERYKALHFLCFFSFFVR